MKNNNFIKNNFFIGFFFIFILIFQIKSFTNITPHHDQTFHVSWLINLLNSDHFLPPTFFVDFKSLLYDTGGFVHELLKPANNPSDYHAYLFQINSILLVYLFSIFFTTDPIKLYIFVSILFSSLSLILNYKILITILKDYKIYQNSFLNNFYYQLIFCAVNISFYKYFFSPLGHHNIGYFFFSLTILILINKTFNNLKNFPYIIGIILGFVSYFQITVVLLLLPSISLFFLFYNYEVSFRNFKNFFKFFSTCFIFYIPFLILIINDLLQTDKNFFINLIGNESSNIKFYLEKITFWLKKFYQFGYPTIFIGFFISIIISVKLKKSNYIQYIILVHFLINILLSIFYISYIRNFYYVFNIFLILTSFSLIYLYQTNNFLKLISIILIVSSLFYNIKVISNNKKLETIDTLFYQLYFEDRGNIKNKILKVTSLNKENFVFYSDFSKNYFKAYDYTFIKKKVLSNRPLLNTANHLKTKNKTYSKHVIKNFTKLDDEFNVISFSRNFNETAVIINELKNFNLINQKCKIVFPHLMSQPIFRDSGTGEFNVNIYLTKVNC